MTRRSSTISADYFDELYTKNADPWGFRTSAYEQAKYADTLAALERPRYETALEIGCSIGVFTRLLAPRCDRLIATEPSQPALAVARRDLAASPNVTFDSGMLPHNVPDGPFQLIVASEVLYYLDRADATAAAHACSDRLAPGGEVVLCHWLGETDYPLTGDEAAELFLQVVAERGWQTDTRRRAEYRIDHIRGRSQ